MPGLNRRRESGNGRKYDTLASNRMTGINSFETSSLLNSYRSNADSESEARILIQEEVNEQIKSYIIPLNKQLEDLTWLIQGISSAHERILSPRASTSANSSATGKLSDKASLRSLTYMTKSILSQSVDILL